MLLDVSDEEIEMVEQNQPMLYQLGVTIDHAGARQIRVSEIPAVIKEKDAEDTICRVLQSLIDTHSHTPPEIRHACLAMTACKAAIKQAMC